ncbi:hypothetical protein NECAME_14892, partial [Necator americanus]
MCGSHRFLRCASFLGLVAKIGTVQLKVRLFLSSRAEMNEVITRAKAAVLGIRVPSPPRTTLQPAVIQQVTEQPISGMDYTAQTQQPTQQQYAVPVVSEQSLKPSSFAPDPSEFNKPLYMRGPPQPQQPQHVPAAPPQQPVIPAQNGDYHSAHRPAYPSPADNYASPAHVQSQNPPRPHAPPPAESSQSYEKRYPPRHPEPRNYSQQASYRHEDNYFNHQAQQHNVEPAPRFFGAPPRNPTVIRPPPPGMTMPPGYHQPPKDTQTQNAPTSGRDGAASRQPYGVTNSQFRGPPGPSQGRESGEENNNMGYQAPNQQERYNGPVALQRQSQQQDDQRNLPGGPHAPYPQDARNHVNGNAPAPSVNRQSTAPPRPFPPQRDSWRADNGPAQHSGAPPMGSNAPRTDNHTGAGAGQPQRKPLLSTTPLGAFNDTSRHSGPQSGPGPRVPPVPPRNPLGPPQPAVNRTPLLGPNFGAGPTLPRSSQNVAKYVELSRLPTEMLRPAVLEQFLRPSVPLQVSSVKVVYSSQGIHMHTLVRFDNPADAEAVISRNGELGI